MAKFKTGEEVTITYLGRVVHVAYYEADGKHLKCRWHGDNNELNSDIFLEDELEARIRTTQYDSKSF